MESFLYLQNIFIVSSDQDVLFVIKASLHGVFPYEIFKNKKKEIFVCYVSFMDFVFYTGRYLIIALNKQP